MSGYKPKLTQKILKIIKNSNIIDPTLITTLGDLKKINTTFFVFINHLIDFYHNNIHIFDYPKDKTFDSLLNHIITKSNTNFKFFGNIDTYNIDYSRGLSLSYIINYKCIKLCYKSENIYLLFYYNTFYTIISNDIKYLKIDLYNFNLFFKNRDIHKGLKFFILIQYLKILYGASPTDIITDLKIKIILDFFFENDYFNISMIQFKILTLRNYNIYDCNTILTFNTFFDFIIYIEPNVIKNTDNTFYQFYQSNKSSKISKFVFYYNRANLSEWIYSYRRYYDYRFLWMLLVYIHLKPVSYFMSDEYREKKRYKY